ncbi:MAG: phosphodiester glycosidase family protein [Solobacterium sp.]|nr:phosphodiester glycosidase family protein [Solobacterium sp.]
MKKKFMYTIDFLIIFALSTYVLLDAFIIPRAYGTVSDNDVASTTETTTDTNDNVIESEKEETNIIQSSITQTISTDTDYDDGEIKIHLESYRYEDTTVYVADVQLASIDSLKSVFAQNTYGKNITATTSDMADDSDAILAINGDYYGSRNSGYVLRNGTIYRSIASNNQEDLVIDSDGNFSIIQENEVALEDIENALQVYSFGPALLIDGEIAVTEDEEVGKAMASNPRTAICQIDTLHYLFVVSDGRTSESEGLSLRELAEFLTQFDVQTAYNLDGGGSSTMVFNGQIINNPTTSGRSTKERSVSDAIIIQQ